MGQIGILARVADERSRQHHVRGATIRANVAMSRIGDATFAAGVGWGGKSGRHVGRNESVWIDRWRYRDTSSGLRQFCEIQR